VLESMLEQVGDAAQAAVLDESVSPVAGRRFSRG